MTSELKLCSTKINTGRSILRHLPPSSQHLVRVVLVEGKVESERKVVWLTRCERRLVVAVENVSAQYDDKQRRFHS